MSTIIQLDANGIDRLIGDDPEIRLNLKKAAMQEFMIRRVYPMINKEVVPEILGPLKEVSRTAANAAVSEIIKETYGWSPSTSISAKARNAIKQAVRTQINIDFDKTIKSEVENTLKSEWVKEFIDHCVEAHLRDEIKKEIDKKVKAKLAKVMEAME